MNKSLENIIEKKEIKTNVNRDPLCFLAQKNGVICVDNSGSTHGNILENMKKASEKLCSKYICLWNTDAEPITIAQDTYWRSCGCTNPSSIARRHSKKFQNCTLFGLFTDGQVSSQEVELLSVQFKQGLIPNNIPYILGISINIYRNSPQYINNLNVSVLLSAFESGQSCIIIVMSSIWTKLIAVKGPWADNWPNIPNLSDNPMLSEFPNIDIEKDINTLYFQKIESIPSNCIQVFPEIEDTSNNIFHINLNKLLGIEDANQIIEIFNTLSVNDAETIARYYNRLNENKIIRNWVGKIQNMMELYKTQSIKESSSLSNESNDINNLFEQLNNSSDTKNKLEIAKLISACATSAKNKEKNLSNDILSKFKKARHFLSTILSVLTELEKSSYGATILGRKSNRAMRADVVNVSDIVNLSTLTYDDNTFRTECIISGDDSCIVGILISCVPFDLIDNNTCDYALNMPTAQFSKECNLNRINNCLINIEDGTAENILSQFGTDPTSRRPVKQILPIISLNNDINKKQAYLRLCDAFFGGKKMATNVVWQLTLSNIMWTINTCEWASPNSNSEMYKALHYFGEQILDNIYIYDNIRDGVKIPMKNAYAKAICEDVLTKDYPADGTAMILMIMHEWNIVPDNGCSLSNIATISLHMQIVKTYQSNIKKNNIVSKNILIGKLFNVYSYNNKIIEIAGVLRDVINFNYIIHKFIIDIFDKLANILAFENSFNFIVPSTRLVIWACINCVNINASSSSAIDDCINYQNLASEFNPKLVGLITDDDAISILRGYLSWAETPRCPVPPFATPFGPSLIWFYNIMSDHSIINMLQTWEGNDSIKNGSYEAEKLCRKINNIFTDHLDDEFKFSDGSFVKNKTTAYNLHKAMWITWNIKGVHPKDQQYIAEVIHFLIKNKKGNVHVQHLAKDICSLIPSLLQVGPIIKTKKFKSITDRIPFQDRLFLEINKRKISEIKNTQPPDLVYFDDETIEKMLESYDLTNIYKVNQIINSPLLNFEPSKMKIFNDKIMGRKLVAGLRHNSWNRSHTYSTNFELDGYVKVDEIINIMKKMGTTLTFEQMQRCAHICNKKRLSIKIDDDKTKWIRATQGHSVAAVKLEHSHTLLNEDRFNYCYHGTSETAVDEIMKTGLDRMNRNAIQMSIGKIGDPNVISGIRTNVDVVLQINMKAAIHGGIKFYISYANNVIVSKGPIHPRFITVLRGDDRFYR